MADKQTLASHSRAAVRARFAFVAIAALSFLFVQSLLIAAHANPKNKKYSLGRVKIFTSTGSYPLRIDGESTGNKTPFVWEGNTQTFEQKIDLPPGTYTLQITFPNNERWVRQFVIEAGRIYCVGLAYTPRSISIPAKLPCPYPVNVSAPASVNDGEVITFTADVAYSGSSALNYTWTISPATARIINGAGTPTIMVDSTGIGRQPVTAILVVDDGSGERACRQTAQAVTNVISIPPPPVKARLYDQFQPPAFDDVKARLDNLAIELQNAPTAQGYIIVYSGRRSRPGQADRLAARAKAYMVKERGIDNNRLIVINGGYRDSDYFELWLVPQGAEPPQASPTVQPGDAQPSTDQRPRRSRRG